MVNRNYQKKWKREQWEHQNRACPWCNKPLALEDATKDHIIPSAHGGADWPGNWQLLHPLCNQEKADGCPGGCPANCPGLGAGMPGW